MTTISTTVGKNPIEETVCYLMMPVFYAETLSKLRFFKRGFFISLLPLLVLLFVGLYRRVHEYGFTTNRYLVLFDIQASRKTRASRKGSMPAIRGRNEGKEAVERILVPAATFGIN